MCEFHSYLLRDCAFFYLPRHVYECDVYVSILLTSIVLLAVVHPAYPKHSHLPDHSLLALPPAQHSLSTSAVSRLLLLEGISVDHETRELQRSTIA